jgi:hypothetical protein
VVSAATAAAVRARITIANMDKVAPLTFSAHTAVRAARYVLHFTLMFSLTTRCDRWEAEKLGKEAQ